MKSEEGLKQEIGNNERITKEVVGEEEDKGRGREEWKKNRMRQWEGDETLEGETEWVWKKDEKRKSEGKRLGKTGWGMRQKKESEVGIRERKDWWLGGEKY